MNDKMINNVNDNNNNNNFEEIQVNLKLNKNIAQVGRLIAKYYDNEDFDKFISEEVSKVIMALSTMPEFPDELKQHIQKKLLLSEEEKKEKKKDFEKLLRKLNFNGLR